MFLSSVTKSYWSKKDDTPTIDGITNKMDDGEEKDEEGTESDSSPIVAQAS